jgi:hypothetical protein
LAEAEADQGQELGGEHGHDRLQEVELGLSNPCLEHGFETVEVAFHGKALVARPPSV